MTFSIAARCRATGHFGIAICSSSPAVAARCAHVRAGVGAVCSQNVTDPRLGPAALDLMDLGTAAPIAVKVLADSWPNMEFRQLIAVDAKGRTGAFSGAGTLGTGGIAETLDCIAAGNLLANAHVPAAMVSCFDAATGGLGDKLISGISAGLLAGGEVGPVHSAGLLVAAQEAWPIADLRVDWDDSSPIDRLAMLWDVWKPQMNVYVQRAINPIAAPSFGVPGNN